MPVWQSLIWINPCVGIAASTLSQRNGLRNPIMDTLRRIASTAPEIFLLLAFAMGTILGRVKIRGFGIGTTACILIVSVLMAQLGGLTFPSLLRVILFSLFVFTIGYRSGPEFSASLSIRTMTVLGPIIVACTFVG
jgi:putative transport protein